METDAGQEGISLTDHKPKLTRLVISLERRPSDLYELEAIDVVVGAQTRDCTNSPWGD